MERPYYRPGLGLGAAAAGVAAGAVIGAAASQPTVVYPSTNTAEWNALCARKYKSFRPSDGTYLGYDGVRHVCRIP